jgi:hypothetical protein
MLSWLHRWRPSVPIVGFGVAALADDPDGHAVAEARRLQQEAGAGPVAKHWERLALSLARRTHVQADGKGPATAAAKALFAGQSTAAVEIHPDLQKLHELARDLEVKPSALRIQFLRSSETETWVLKEIQVGASSLSDAVIVAANSEWPPQTDELRVVDRDEREVFSRKRDRRHPGPPHLS